MKRSTESTDHTNLNPQNIDQKIQEGQQQKTAADFDQNMRDAESETGTREPGQSLGTNSNQHNNGRGGAQRGGGH